MSDTPRTDEYYSDDENPTYRGFISVEFARQLERELAEAQTEVERLALEIENQQYTITCASEENQQLKESLAEARAEIERLREWEYCMKTQAPYEAAGATWELRHRHDQAVIAERDKLIEQMRDALESVRQKHYVNDDDNWYSCPASGLCSNDHAGTDCNCGADHVNHIIDAALSAAERINK